MTDALLTAGALVLFIGLLMWGYRLLAAVPDDEPDWTAEAQRGLIDSDEEEKHMTTTAEFWRDPAFTEFLPYINATAAWDKRHGNSPRLDLKSSTPLTVVTKALAFRGACAECGREMHVFRTRSAKGKRGTSGKVYLAATCPLAVSIGCSRGRRASVAYAALWELVRAAEATK